MHSSSVHCTDPPLHRYKRPTSSISVTSRGRPVTRSAPPPPPPPRDPVPSAGSTPSSRRRYILPRHAHFKSPPPHPKSQLHLAEANSSPEEQPHVQPVVVHKWRDARKRITSIFELPEPLEV